MMGTDDDGGVSGDDFTEVEASAECSDMKGKMYLSLDSFILGLLQGLYTMMRCNVTHKPDLRTANYAPEFPPIGRLCCFRCLRCP
jgi:hypothetical protein